MTYNGLKEILRKSFTIVATGEIEDTVRELCLNPGTNKDIPEQHLQSWYSRFLVFNYKNFGFEYISGKIDCCGVTLVFKKEGYDMLTVNVFVDRRTSYIYNSCLLRPKFNIENFKGKKSFTQIANTVRNDKDFERYIKRINKRFNLN